MKNKHLLTVVTVVALLIITATGYSQNVGIGQNAPLSKLDVKGNLVVGADYSGTAAPINGAIIEGNVGIGTTSASALLTIGTSSPVTVDNSGNVTISSLNPGDIVVTGAGGLLQTITTPGIANTYLQWTGSAYTWASASASLANLTAGTGLSGSVYNGSTAQTWSVNYGNTAGTAVQGNTTLNITAGTALTGGGTVTLGSSGNTITLNVGIVGVANGGTGNTTLTTDGILYGKGTAALGITAAGTNGQVLVVNSSGVPTWSTITAASTNAWALVGNGSTTAGTNYVGTSDGNDLVFKTNAAENMRLSNSTGNVVIGSGEGGSAVGNTIRAPYNNSGGNKTGADFTIAAGAPTGKGGSGNIIFQELAPNVGSPGNTSDLSIMAEAMRITNTGALSFGSTETATGNANNVLISGGSTINPSWGQLSLNDNVNAVTGTLAAGNGGTGQSSYTTGDILYASSSTALSKLSDVATGDVLISGGTGTAPSWGQIGLTTGVTGILPVVNGGTGDNTLTSKGILYGNGTGAVSVTAAGNQGQILTVNSSGIPVWTTATYPATTTINQVLFSSATNTVTGITAANNGVLTTSSTGVPSWLAPGTDGYVLTLSSSGAPTWASASAGLANLTASTGLTGSVYNGSTAQSWSVSYGSTAGTAVQGNTSLTLTANAPLTGGGTVTLGSGPTVTLNLGTVGVANGGTGLTSLTADAILYASGTATVGQLADVAAGSYLRSAGTASAPVWSTLTLPNAATTGDILYATGTNAIGNLQDVATGDVLISGGTSAVPSWGQVGLTTGVTGILPVANGGTGDNTLTSKGILYGNGTAAVGITAAGNQGQILTVNSSGIPVWTTATYPATTTINQILYSSGTNAVTGLATANNGVLTTSSTGVPSWLAAGTNGQVLTISSGTPTWATSTPSLATLTPSTGLSGSAYNGSTAQSWTVSYGSTAGTAVQGNTSLTVTAGTDLTGGGTVTLGSGGTITLNVGTVGVANGGTGDNTLTSKGILYGNGTGAVNVTAAGSTGEILTVNTSGIPVWTTATYPATTTINQILYSSGTNAVTGLATANNGVLTTNSSGVPSWLAAGTSGQVLTMSSSGVPSWSTSSSSGTNYWALSGSNLYPTSTTYNIGVGTNSPNTQLDVDGDFAMRKYGGATPSTSFITVTGGGSYTLNPQGYSFVELQASSAFTLTNIDGGENGKVLVVWCSSNGMMSIASTGNIQTYTSGTMSPTSSQMTMGTFIYDVRSSQWILIAYQ